MFSNWLYPKKIGDRKHSVLVNRGELSNEQWKKLKPLLPPQKPQTGKPNHDHREIYRQRNIVEIAINRLKQFRRIATRYEKLAANYTAMITIASIILWL
ncbi:transposase [Nostoc sp. CALU 546]|uniref:transposase n=1 Tax=Nostoc sp. CALU 546 TaxID=1867241 RepID=UPI003B680C53